MRLFVFYEYTVLRRPVFKILQQNHMQVKFY